MEVKKDWRRLRLEIFRAPRAVERVGSAHEDQENPVKGIPDIINSVSYSHKTHNNSETFYIEYLSN